MNIAARLEPETLPGEVWATQTVISQLQALKAELDWKRLGPVVLPKDAGKVDAFCLLRKDEKRRPR